ncbi:MAG: PD-(D/E)XK nuclease family protein [Patescibacteria group bacterium]
MNAAVDHLLKKEFDVYRAKQIQPPLLVEHGLDARPFQHPKLNEWRENFVGVQYHHRPSNFLVTGAVDDVWVKPHGELIVVDYKATSKDSEVTLDAEWQRGYKNQMEIYQWLLAQNGFSVDPTGYFVYANGRRDRPTFDGRLEFVIKLIPYRGETNWIESKLEEIKGCLTSARPPQPNKTCPLCDYRRRAEKALYPQSGQVALWS